MTPDEIRAMDWDGLGSGAIFGVMREIAGQLAEHNQNLRDDRLQRKVALDEERTERAKRDELLTNSAAGIEAFRKSVEAPPVISPRLVFPNEVVHLGCIIREPDGTHAIANEGGLIRLTTEDAQRILALMSPPDPEAKPQ